MPSENEPAPPLPPDLSVRHVSKRYQMVGGGPTELKTAFLHPLQTFRSLRSRNSFWAVRDVSFDVSPGEFFSIVGANGSGKSTLLRLIAGLGKPTEGTVEAAGRISTLLELGSGFHPQVSGRENVIVNGLLAGLTRAEIDRILPGIIAFSGLQEFIDQPMRTYSSGMYVRLGFAIAAFLEPEILVVDEVLAVGDARFQERCYEHIEGLRGRGVTIVMVSHDLAAVERFSTRAALMEQGRMIAIGDPAGIVKEHMIRLVNSSPEIHRAMEDKLPELILSSPEAKAEFDRALLDNPEFQKLMAEKKQSEEGPI